MEVESLLILEIFTKNEVTDKGASWRIESSKPVKFYSDYNSSTDCMQSN